MGTHLHNYKEVREYLEKNHPDWLDLHTATHQRATLLPVYDRASILPSRWTNVSVARLRQRYVESGPPVEQQHRPAAAVLLSLAMPANGAAPHETARRALPLRGCRQPP
jgi:hypothetical protein